MRRFLQRDLKAILLGCLLPVSAPAATEGWIIVRWPTNTATGNRAIEISGIDDQNLRELRRSDWDSSRWQQLLSVYAEQGDVISDVSLPAMIGSYRVVSETLCFEPQFPLEPGVTYRATFRPARLPSAGKRGVAMVASSFRVPSRPASSTTVVREIYPTANVLPENLLKFYVHFSAPMRRGHIYDHIHLRDDAGKAIELPFLEIDEELWDPGMTRLTLIIDPGRIKRGVRPLEEIGPALESGKRFTLEIAETWRDAGGNPLRAPFRKSFTVGTPDRDPPDPATWRITAPRRGTREPLIVQFPEPMEHALAGRMIHVANGSGGSIAGKAELSDHEQRWVFVPQDVWKDTTGKLAVETTIEDLAGNNIGKPFEVDMVETAPHRLTRATVTLDFTLR